MAAKNLIAWVGGKRLLRPVISSFIPENISSYCEPFGGAGWVLFYKNQWADLEIYNDLDGRLVNLFRIVKYHPDELKKEIKGLLASREMFEQYLNSIPFTDIQKASKFYFLISFSFGAGGKHFATSKTGCRAIKSVINLNERIDSISLRLDKVLIENRDFETLIKEYDNKNAFFYCDPPYTEGAGYSTTSTKDFEHNRLKNALKKLKGRFLLSYNDSEEVRKAYKDFNIFEVVRQKGINNYNTKDKNYKELLICNYEPQAELNATVNAKNILEEKAFKMFNIIATVTIAASAFLIKLLNTPYYENHLMIATVILIVGYLLVSYWLITVFKNKKFYNYGEEPTTLWQLENFYKKETQLMCVELYNIKGYIDFNLSQLKKMCTLYEYALAAILIIPTIAIVTQQLLLYF